MITQFKSARRVGTPLIAIKTADPAATIQTINANTPAESPIMQWDICRGAMAINEAGQVALNDLTREGPDPKAMNNPTEALVTFSDVPERTIVFILNAQRYLRDDRTEGAISFTQALWNLRDLFKADSRTIVLLGPAFTFPAELSQDIFELDEPLPDEKQLDTIVREVIKSADLTSQIKKPTYEKAVDALRGLAAFPAEQVTAMSLSGTGLDLGGLWERKRQMISATPGLSVYAGTEKFDDIGGCDQVKEFMRGIIGGLESPRVIVFIDEIEKAMAGSSAGASDSSGVSQDFLGTLLSYMENTEAGGCIFVGPPGAAKSAISKATGSEAGIPTIVLDLGGMKASLVGESETRLRNALKVITAVGGGRALFLATSNKIANLPPELRRRFTDGTFFFPLPDSESDYNDRKERDRIWTIYLKKYRIADEQVEAVKDKGWTGAEIRNCCRLAYRQRRTLEDASRFILPVAITAQEQIAALCREADGRYLSASSVGVYRQPTSTMAKAATQTTGRRAINQDV